MAAQPTQESACPVNPNAYKYFLPQKDLDALNSEDQKLKCPVSHPQPGQQDACPVAHNNATTTATATATALTTPSSTEKAAFLNEKNNMPVEPEQQRSPQQRGKLSTHRELSTIPMSNVSDAPSSYSSATADDASCTSDALKSESRSRKESESGGQEPVWVYPSEQMFFNAMRRKKWNPKEEDMKTVVPIHNAVNERCWMEVLKWEQLHKSNCAMPTLVKFEGRPNDYTPKARFRSLLGYNLPFDRHDWVVDRCGHRVKYVIDFYSGKPDPRNPDAPSFFLDVRPAFGLEGIRDRALRIWHDLLR